MDLFHILLFAFLIGFFAGLRAITPPAATAFAAHAGWEHLPRALSWIGALPAVIIFSALALFELVNDKLPKTPSRVAAGPLAVRALTGAFAGACIAAAGSQGIVFGALLGVAGAMAGAFGGYHARKALVGRTGAPDFVIAVIEDVLAVGGSLWIVSRF
jgi:uncharacterized membrane protein